jgi:Protein of unknown function (DUF642)
LAYKTSFSPRWHHNESDTVNLASDVRASIEAAAAAAIASIKSAAEIGNPQLLADDAIDHVANAAESTGIDFTAAGSGRGASGTVTFTDAADHQAVDVAGNGSHTAGLSDGTMKSLLQASDGAGHSTTGTGNSGSLDADGGVSPTLSVNALNPTQVVSAGGTLELSSPYSGTISFAGASGTLKIDNSASFTGKIAGQLAIGDVIDLANITAGVNAKISYSGNNSPGTLTVSDGTHSANIALEGNYSLANFTVSSDGHGGTLVVDPPVLPAGVTLQQIDGGPNYYANNGSTYAAAAGWDNPNFFPIGPWLDMLVTQSDADRWHDLGWNTAFVLTANSNISIAGTNGISVIQDGSGPLLPGSGAETVGLLSADENWNAAVNSVNTEANGIQDHRFWWLQTTWTVENYGDIGGVPMAQIMSQPLTTPNGTTRHFDTLTSDIYWFTGGHYTANDAADNDVSNAGGLIYSLGRNMTADEAARGSNYGDMVDILRSYQTADPAPIAQFIEDGDPGSAGTNADYITPPELNWATWSSIIHGAREIIYFNHTFAGNDQSDDNVAQPFYQTVQPGQTISIYGQIKATDALIEQLAPVINSPFAMNYATVSGPHYSYGTLDLTLGGLEVMAKDDNGQFYIFADTRDSETATNIPATFTIADKNATSVTVVNENRTIPVVNGVFSDTFATAATVHIYEVNDSGVAPPPPAPAAPANAAGNGSALSAPPDPVIQSPTAVGGQSSSGGQTSSGGQNLLVNGSFESGDYTGWTLGGNYKPLSYGDQTFIVTGAESGNYAAGLGSVGSDGTLSQNVQTTAGQQYTVSFWLANQGAGSDDFTVTWNGQTLLALADKPAQDYTQYSFTVAGTAGTSHLEFDARQDPAYWSLDNVSVVAVGSQPPPAAPTTAASSDGSHSSTATDTASGQTSSASSGFTSTATDAAGNVSATSAAKGVTVDPPASASAVGITDLSENSRDIVTIKGTADAHSQVKIYDGTQSVGTVSTGANGSWSYTSSSAVSNTVHTFTAQELDSTGHVVASSGSAILGSTGSNTLTGTGGNDLFVGNGHNDTFVFAPNFGNEVIMDFRAGGHSHDVIQFSKTVFDSFASVLAHATQTGQDVVISADASDSVTLKNTKLGALNSHDFHFA